MKANIRKNEVVPANKAKGTGANVYHGHPIRLTIGMIVKNEEKTLDRCLSSLKPLMEAVESELIITDTGSTDNTVEIAEKYTDHILHFDWCDDFSAARNTGLAEARGEWFLFLDGDEWFESTNELIQFFNSGECENYNSATYIQRNYLDYFGKKYSDYNTLRITRMYSGIHFEHIVHEDFGNRLPVKFLTDYVHHYGYIFHSLEEKNEKLERNAILLERELEKDPTDLKMYSQLARQYLVVDMEKTEEYCTRGLMVEKEHPDCGWKIILLIALTEAFYRSQKYQKLLRVIDKIAQEFTEDEIYWLDFYYMAQAAAFHLNKFENSIEYGKNYLKVWEKYQSGQLNQEALLYASYSFIQSDDREQVLQILAQTYLNLNQTEQAEELMGRLSLSEECGIEGYFKLAAQICRKAENWESLSGFYQKACCAVDSSHKLEMLHGLEAILPKDKEQRAQAVGAIAMLPRDDDPYVRLCRLKRAESGKDGNAVKRELDWFNRWNGEWNSIYSDVLFFSMKEKINLLPLILKIEMEDLKNYAENMKRQHADFLKVIQDYFEAFSYENIKGLYWSACLREKVLLCESPIEWNGGETAFFEEYAKLLAKYVRALYRPELLLSDRISVLPRAHRFGYYMGLAFSARDKMNNEAYLSNLNRALQCYPVMEHPISLLLEKFEQDEKLRREKADEFQRLAVQVKVKIQQLISKGKMVEAGQITSQLAELMPEDEDVVRFRMLTHTEPNMKELAARLPQ